MTEDQLTFGTSPWRRVTQLLEAPGWYALYWDKEPPYYSISPLIAWALYDEPHDETQGMAGVDCDAEGLVDFCDDVGNFQTYIFGATVSPELIALCQQNAQEERS